MTFPVKKERKSGFLVPTYGTTSQGGLDISIPYYFNLAPNYDLTLQPRYFSKRGTQLGGEFRYMGWAYNGTLVGTYLPNDQIRDRDRWMFRWTHQQVLGNGFYTDWDYAKVSDNNYFRDISQLGLNQASTTCRSAGRLEFELLEYLRPGLQVSDLAGSGRAADSALRQGA